MSETKSGAGLAKPVPIRDERTAPFFDAAAEGRLAIQRCTACGRASLLGGSRCPACLGPLSWEPASGRGTIHSWTVMHQLAHPAFAAEIPYVIATVELEEGPKLTARLVDLPASDLRLGLPVAVRFVKNEGGEALPVFGPA
jgi:uncharacterized OB-fold protein